MMKLAFEIRWESINCTRGSKLASYGLHVKTKTPNCSHVLKCHSNSWDHFKHGVYRSQLRGKILLGKPFTLYFQVGSGGGSMVRRAVNYREEGTGTLTNA